MLSLGNTYSKAEVADFYERVKRALNEEFEICCELKFDGTSISLTYEDGRLVRAVTRGDGEKGDDVTANNWTLNSLVVKTLKHSGSVDCGSATASWTLTGEKTDEVYYDAGTTFTKEYVKYEKTANNFIVLPQTPTSLDVTYTYTSQEATGTTPAITLTETKNVPLTLINSLSVWSPGIHYIYNVMITATEILIDPVVVEWTEHANNPLQKEVN
jgi:hypothetical protein